jgi:hypothetical protein
MTDRPLGTPQGSPASSDDPTRDVRLPSPEDTTVLEPRTGESAPFAESLRQQTRPFGAPGDHVPTGSGPELARRPVAQPLPAVAAAAPQQPARSGGRPWTWVLLAVLPILVIVVAGVLLYLLLGGG